MINIPMFNILNIFVKAAKLLPMVMMAIEAYFNRPKAGADKKAWVMDIIKMSIGLGEQITGKDLVDEKEFVAGLDQAAEGVLRALKATKVWHDRFPK